MVNSRRVFKMIHGYKLVLQTPESMKLFGSTKKLIDKTKNEELLKYLKLFYPSLI